MYARLWWKDARQFWPIWVFLTIAMALLQALLVYFHGPSMRHGSLNFLAITCACLYAFATGAAAFAGEREAGTLPLLDSLPVDRKVIWTSKFSFAFVTTLLLMLALLAIAALSTEDWRNGGSISVWQVISIGMIVPVALGWGLFWSAISKSALSAAVIAIAATGISLGFLLFGLDEVFLKVASPVPLVLWELFVFVASVSASALTFAPRELWKRLPFELRSPIAFDSTESTIPGHVSIQIPSPPMTVSPSGTHAQLAGVDASNFGPRRSSIIEVRALAWQVIKQGRAIWALLMPIGLLPLGLTLIGSSGLDVFVPTLTTVSVTLVAGACVFGLDNYARTQRFLTHHGVQPGLVWLTRLIVWGTGLVMIWAPFAITAILTAGYTRRASSQHWIAAISLIPLYFSVAILCGMALRRSITAVVIALVIAIALTIPLIALMEVQMMPVQGSLFVFLGLLVVSWGWCGDWQLDDSGPWRWVRLGLMLTVMFTLLIAPYTAYRAWSIPDVGPITAPSIWSEISARPIPPERNAAELYEQANRQLIGPFKNSRDFLKQNRPVVELLHRAINRPHCQFVEPEKPTLFDRSNALRFSQLAHLLAFEADERQERGDHAGAWNDIKAIFKMAHDAGHRTRLAVSLIDLLATESAAQTRALKWAVAPGQSVTELQDALKSYSELPKPPAVADIIRAEGLRFENTLDAPADQLHDLTYELTYGNAASGRPSTPALLDLMISPWERARARRVNRFVIDAEIKSALVEPWQRDEAANEETQQVFRTSPLAMLLMGNTSMLTFMADRNEMARRALVQILAIRIWQLKHDGRFPEHLDALVPSLLAELPADPFSGRPFQFRPVYGQAVYPIEYAVSEPYDKSETPPAGSWVLYSVGRNRKDDVGTVFKNGIRGSQVLDIVFVIPPIQSGGNKEDAPHRSQESPKGPPASDRK